MTNIAKRVGAGALASLIIATVYGAAGSGAVAQDQDELATLDMVEEISEPAVRFVTSEIVQVLPEEPEVEIAPVRDAASLRELTSTIDIDGEMSREVTCLAQAVYFEARGESLDGQLAVARVVVNRAESSTFPDDYCSVVTQRAQFSFVRGGRIPTPNHGSSAWSRAQAIARIAHRDLWDSPAQDSLYFHARYVSPSWARRMTARATIENHIFYR